MRLLPPQIAAGSRQTNTKLLPCQCSAPASDARGALPRQNVRISVTDNLLEERRVRLSQQRRDGLTNILSGLASPEAPRLTSGLKRIEDKRL